MLIQAPNLLAKLISQNKKIHDIYSKNKLHKISR